MAYELIKVSELPELTTPSDPNVLPIQDGDYLKRISFENLKEAATGDVAGDLAAEVTARESAVSGEATARGNADTAILADLASPYSASSTYAVGDYCTKDGQLYRCTTAISTAEAWTAAHWSAVALGNDTGDLRSALSAETEAREAADEALEESVAKKDGTYEDLTSGATEQLLSDVYTENTEPYLFRKTGGSDKVGSREYLDKIVGGSLVVNQLCNSASVTVTNGHKYYMKKSGTASIGASTGSAITGLTSGTDMVIDLTSEFGITIADYVYSLETATAGAGIAWLSQYMDLGKYIPFTENTFKHVTGLQSHDTVGFNQWGEEWEVGAYNSTNGTKVASSGRIRSKNKIAVVPDTYYFVKAPYNLQLYEYREDGAYLRQRWSNTSNAKIHISSDAHYITFNSVAASGETYNHDICINLFDPQKNGTYEPYVKHSYPLDSSVILRGIPTLVGGKIVNDGDEYLYNGSKNIRYGIVDLGTLDWTPSSTGTGTTGKTFETTTALTLPTASNVRASIVCDSYILATNNDVFGGTKGICAVLTGAIKIYDPDFTGGTPEAFKTYLSGKYAVYKLVTPTTENAEPYRQLQICDTYGTEEFVTTSEVPVGTETRYPEDLKSKIEGLPWDLSMIAPIEDGTTASKAYITGQYFLHNNVFCKALTNIASGATFTLNTNYTETTVAAELYTALH